MFHCYACLPLRVPIENFTSRSGTIGTPGTPSPLNHIAGLCLGGEAPLGRWFLEMGWDWWDLDLWLLWWDGQIIEMNHPQEWGLPSDNKLKRRLKKGPSCTCTELLQNTDFLPTYPTLLLAETAYVIWSPHVSNIKHKSTPNELWVSLNICVAWCCYFFYEKQCLEYPHPDL